MVSEIGSFAEFPEDVCLKVPVGAGEEDLIFEYLNLLVSRPEVAQALGARARDYVAQQCNWTTVARQYANFLEAVSLGKQWRPAQVETIAAPDPSPSTPPPVAAPELESYLRGWAVSREAETYLETHQTRLVKTLEITPPGGPDDRILEMGAYLQVTPALRSKLGYGEVRGCYYGPAGRVDPSHRDVGRGRDFRLRYRPLRRREGPLPV